MSPELKALLSEVKAAHRAHDRRLIGLTPDELSELKRAIGVELPKCLRSTLKRVGLLTNPFRMHERITDWVNANESVRYRIECALEDEELDRESEEADFFKDEKLVSFATDEADRKLVLRVDDDSGDQVLAFDSHGCEVEPTGRSFVEWCRAQWAEAQDRLDTPRRWTVQFSFEGNPDALVTRLAKALGGEVSTDWSDEGIGPAGVHSFSSALVVDGEEFRIRLLRCGDWPAPMLSLNASDPESNIENGLIVRFRDAFRRAEIPVKEIDYGLLPADDDSGDDA